MLEYIQLARFRTVDEKWTDQAHREVGFVFYSGSVMPPSQAVPQTLAFDGPVCRLRARDWGGDGLPVLLLHGMSGNTHWWDGVAPRLEGLRPIALDLRAHGESGWADDIGAYRLESFAEDVEAARRALGLEEFAIAGHSFGARVALEYAAKPRSGLRRLAVLDFLCEVPPGGFDRFTRARARMQPKYETRDAILDRFRFHPSGTLLSPQAVREFGSHCVREEPGGGWTWRFDWRAFSLRFSSVWDALALVDLPLLVIRGERSTTMPRAAFDRVLACRPAAESLEVPRAFHHVILDAPEACAERLTRFLRAA